MRINRNDLGYYNAINFTTYGQCFDYMITSVPPNAIIVKFDIIAVWRTDVSNYSFNGTVMWSQTAKN